MKPGMADDGEPGSREDGESGADGDGESGADDDRVPGADDDRVPGAGGDRESGRADEPAVEDPVDLVLELVEIDPAEVRCGISLDDSGDSTDSKNSDDE